MSFEIKLNIELTYDPVTLKYYINGKEVDDYTFSILDLNEIKLTSKKENNSIIFDLPEDAIEFIKQRYYN